MPSKDVMVSGMPKSNLALMTGRKSSHFVIDYSTSTPTAATIIPADGGEVLHVMLTQCCIGHAGLPVFEVGKKVEGLGSFHKVHGRKEILGMVKYTDYVADDFTLETDTMRFEHCYISDVVDGGFAFQAGRWEEKSNND